MIAYFIQSSDPPSITALIPAFMGMPMILLGLLSERVTPPPLTDTTTCMHVVALAMVLGGARVVTLDSGRCHGWLSS
ncbi:MAG: hypothetical protein ABGX21_03740, partial [Candidatus Poseidoniia archaeon]